MKYWEIIADNLSKAGWSWGCVSSTDRKADNFGRRRATVTGEKGASAPSGEQPSLKSPSGTPGFLPSNVSDLGVELSAPSCDQKFTAPRTRQVREAAVPPRTIFENLDVTKATFASVWRTDPVVANILLRYHSLKSPLCSGVSITLEGARRIIPWRLGGEFPLLGQWRRTAIDAHP